MGASLSSPVSAVFMQREQNSYLRSGVAEMQGSRISHEDGHSMTVDLPDGSSVFVVLDGHGGDKSARWCAKHLSEAMAVVPDKHSDEALVEVFRKTDERLQAFLEGDGSGSTCVAGYVLPEHGSNGFVIKIANAGDSRCLHTRGKKVVAATEDHKPDNQEEKARIEKAGGFVEAAMGGPPRLDGNLALSRAFGDFQYKQRNDLPFDEQKCSIRPDIYTWKAQQGDRIVLCCDGIFDVMENSVCAEAVDEAMVRNDLDPGLSCADLVKNCLERGSSDNMTAMVVSLDPGIDGDGKWVGGYDGRDCLQFGGFPEEDDDAVCDKYKEFIDSKGFAGVSQASQECGRCQCYFEDMQECPCGVAYCGRKCQRAEWKTHKKTCTARKPKTTTNGMNGTDGGDETRQASEPAKDIDAVD